MISYNSENVKMPKIRKRDTSAWIKQVAASYGRKIGEVGYMFVDDEKILEVNNEYLGHDYYTDIITFDYDEDDIINGDLVISLDTVKSNAELFGIIDFFQHGYFCSLFFICIDFWKGIGTMGQLNFVDDWHDK